jgi:hypothetical protein
MTRPQEPTLILADAVLDDVLSVVDNKTGRPPTTVELRDRLKDPAWRIGSLNRRPCAASELIGYLSDRIEI